MSVDVIIGWVGLDGVYRCHEHTENPVGCLAVFHPKSECQNCKEESAALLRASSVHGEPLVSMTEEEIRNWRDCDEQASVSPQESPDAATSCVIRFPPVTPDPTKKEITMHVCGGKQARVCPKDGGEHDMSAIVRFQDGGSVACSKCGVTAMQLDMMELP